MRLATWNVRSMCPGHTDNPQQISDSRKTAIIDLELSKLDIDIAALQETWLAEDGMLWEKIYMFLWHGRPHEEQWLYSVCFAVRKSLVMPPNGGSECLLSLWLSTSPEKVEYPKHLHPNTVLSSGKKRQGLWGAQCGHMQNTKIWISDFNVRGSNCNSWPETGQWHLP